MFTRLRPGKPSPALVISCIALFVALSGSSYAVIVLPKNSVGAKQIKTNAVGPTEIAKNAVRAEEVRDGSLSAADFAPGQLSVGPPGPPGPAGPSNPNADTLDGLDSTAFLGNGAAAGGDLSGNYPSPTVGPNAIGGAEIDESTLGLVPSAANADNVDGQSVQTFNFNRAGDINFPPPLVTLFTLGGFTLRASCASSDGNDTLRVNASTDMDNSYIRSNIPGANADEDWDSDEAPGGGISGGTPVWFFSTDDKSGTIVYRRGSATAPGAQVVSVAIAWDTTGVGCQLAGTVIGH